MDPISVVGLQLVVLFVLTVPLGLVFLRIGERLLGRTFNVTAPERLLLAFYTAGCFFLVLGWVPLPLYGFLSISGSLVLGIVAYACLTVRDGGSGLRDAIGFVVRWPAWILGALTVGLLIIELSGVESLLVGNMLDGSAQSLWLNLLLRNHTLALTLAPYSNAGVEYPQAITVWMSQPIVLFGWAIVKAPLYVPTLFLALSVPAAYCLGARWAGLAPSLPAASVGLVFAAAFALIIAFRGMLVGGTFDFSFGLPLFLVVLGWLPFLTRRFLRCWEGVVALWVVIGVVASIGPMLGAYLLLFLGAFGLLHVLRTSGSVVRWLIHCVASVLVSSLLLLRSIVTVLVWFSYPDHVLADAGSPPYLTSFPPAVLSLPDLNGEVNPFIPFKAELSPFAAMSSELQILLAAGVLLLLIGCYWSRTGRSGGLPLSFSVPIVGGMLISLAETVGLLLLYSIPSVGADVASVTYLQEASQTLFFFYTLIALLPIVAAVAWLAERKSSEREYAIEPSPVGTPVLHAFRRPPPSLRGNRVFVFGSVLLIGIPLASGALTAGLIAPGYISNHIHSLANVTEGDLDAARWVGSNLPTCSRVLAAPGTVGMYLPEFAEVRLVFPGYPAATNLSYAHVVAQLVHGIYTNTTRQMMLSLGITEVLVSGQNNVGFPPFQLGPLEGSVDFALLYASGHVTIWEFVPGVQTSQCSIHRMAPASSVGVAHRVLPTGVYVARGV